MIARLQQDKTVIMTLCDASGRLGYAQTFGVFQDIAADHAEQLGFGGTVMASKGLFWITMRTRVRFYERPAMMTPIQITTWPAEPKGMHVDRFYRMESGDTLCAEGRTQWCVLDIAAGRQTDPSVVYGELEYAGEQVLEEPYARLKHDFKPEETVLEYTVLPSDIDIGNHMNNVAYPRLLMNSFTVAEQRVLSLHEAEILFMSPCMEGETLLVRRRQTETGFEFGVCHADGKYAALARFLTK